MSTIRATSNENVYKIQKFLGMNENPDGDTKLKLGEASICRNWKITRDWNLQKRPGMLTKYDTETNSPVAGMWFGNINGTDTGLAACGGHMWKFYENDTYLEELEDLGELDTSGRVNFFAYSNIVYILNGEEYYSYDGVKFGFVQGYRPLIITSREPNGAGSTLLEEVNKLTGMRRVWFSPDGTSSEFLLPENDLLSIDYVKYNSNGNYVLPKYYTKDRLRGIVRFRNDETVTSDGTNYYCELQNENVASIEATSSGVPVSVVFDKENNRVVFADVPEAESEITVTETATETETFVGESGRRIFLLNNRDIASVSVTVNDEETEPTFDSENWLITFAEAPEDGAEIIVTESISKTETFTGDGEKYVFQLANKGFEVSVEIDETATTDYFYDTEAATITFIDVPAADTEFHIEEAIAPERDVDSIEIGYSAVSTYRNDVVKNTNAELFLGAQDNAVFLYGNGTNKAIYSSIDYWGKPRADYFPDLNEVAVADSNTPITGMIRHFSKLICYKTYSTYAIQFGMITTAGGDSQYGFYVTPVNREIGNAALGQVRLVLNSPYALFGNDLYQWTNNSRYSSNLSSDERQARRISDRVNGTLRTFEARDCYCYDDNPGQEYYICYEDKALVFNYAADAWYLYDGLRINSMCNTHDDLLVGTSNGHICRLSTDYLNDDGNVIDCHWESGSIDFGREYMRKLMTEIWVTVKPQAHSNVTVTVQTDKKSEFTEKIIDSMLFSFSHVDFKHFSFKINRKPQTKKLKIKAKKFAFLKLIFRTSELYSTATILSADPKIRETGYVK